ncbi:MAG: hypothetical protein R2727_08765 [Bacteroidales bacterium]
MKKEKSNLTEKWMALLFISAIMLGAAILTGFTRDSEVKEITEADTFLAPPPAPADDLTSSIPQDKPKKLTSTINTRFVDPADNRKKDVEMEIKDGVLYELTIEGVKIPGEDFHLYQDLVEKTLTDLEDARLDIEEAMKEVSEINYEALRAEMEEVRREIRSIDHEKIREELEMAREEMEQVDMEAIRRDIEAARIDMEKALKDIQVSIYDSLFVDMEAMQLEMQEALKTLQTIKIDSIIENFEFNFEMPDLPDLTDLPDPAKILEELEGSMADIQNALPPDKKSPVKKK